MRRTARKAVGMTGALALIALICAAFGASSASAIGIAKWEAGTCAAPGCTYAGSPAEFFAQAAGHPPDGVTDFSLTTSGESDQAKRVKVELPAGLNVNPVAVPQCPLDAFQADACPSTSQVGESSVTTELEVPILGGVLPKAPVTPPAFPVYSLVPNQGEPGLFGFHVTAFGIVNEFVYLETAIEWGGDYHESFFINNIAAFPPLGRDRLTFNGQAASSKWKARSARPPVRCRPRRRCRSRTVGPCPSVRAWPRPRAARPIPRRRSPSPSAFRST
jgi:hypothetical protein